MKVLCLLRTIYHGPTNVKVANGTSLSIAHIGDANLNSLGWPLHLKLVFHVPNWNIIYYILAQKLRVDNKCTINFDKHSFFDNDQNSGEVLL